MDDFSLWTEASRDVEAETALRSLTAARVRAAAFWPFLAAAKDAADFDNRLALAEAKIVAAADSTGISAEALAASLREDFGAIQASRMSVVGSYYVTTSDGEKVGGPYDSKSDAQDAIDGGDVTGDGLSVSQGDDDGDSSDKAEDADDTESDAADKADEGDKADPADAGDEEDEDDGKGGDSDFPFEKKAGWGPQRPAAPTSGGSWGPQRPAAAPTSGGSWGPQSGAPGKGDGSHQGRMLNDSYHRESNTAVCTDCNQRVPVSGGGLVSHSARTAANDAETSQWRSELANSVPPTTDRDGSIRPGGHPVPFADDHDARSPLEHARTVKQFRSDALNAHPSMHDTHCDGCGTTFDQGELHVDDHACPACGAGKAQWQDADGAHDYEWPDHGEAHSEDNYGDPYGRMDSYHQHLQGSLFPVIALQDGVDPLLPIVQSVPAGPGQAEKEVHHGEYEEHPDNSLVSQFTSVLKKFTG